MEISSYWGGEIFVPRSVNTNAVSGMPDSVPIFFPFNECSFFVETTFYQSLIEIKYSLYEI